MFERVDKCRPRRVSHETRIYFDYFGINEKFQYIDIILGWISRRWDVAIWTGLG